MIIDCVSDLHGNYPALEGGDLLIVAGDLTATDGVDEYLNFYEWLDEQEYKKKVVVAGNHDSELAKPEYEGRNDRFHPALYLCDSGTEFEWFETEDTKWGARHLDGCRHLKLKIWGSPWTKRFPGMNPKCMAFTVETEEELAEKWAMIPEDVDILVTHCPPALRGLDAGFGSASLNNTVSLRPTNLKLHVFGHIHEGYGERYCKPVRYINASHVNEYYEPVNKPIRIEL